VFASDMPYGRPVGGLFHTLRIAAYAGLDVREREAVAGTTMAALLEDGALAPVQPPRLPPIRSVNGRLARISAYLASAMGAVTGSAPPLQPAKALPGIALARNVCRDPDPGPAGPALEWIDRLLASVEQHAAGPGEDPFLLLGLVMAAATIAATEPLPPPAAQL